MLASDRPPRLLTAMPAILMSLNRVRRDDGGALRLVIQDGRITEGRYADGQLFEPEQPQCKPSRNERSGSKVGRMHYVVQNGRVIESCRADSQPPESAPSPSPRKCLRNRRRHASCASSIPANAIANAIANSVANSVAAYPWVGTGDMAPTIPLPLNRFSLVELPCVKEALHAKAVPPVCASTACRDGEIHRHIFDGAPYGADDSRLAAVTNEGGRARLFSFSDGCASQVQTITSAATGSSNCLDSHWDGFWITEVFGGAGMDMQSLFKNEQQIDVAESSLLSLDKTRPCADDLRFASGFAPGFAFGDSYGLAPGLASGLAFSGLASGLASADSAAGLAHDDAQTASDTCDAGTDSFERGFVCGFASGFASGSASGCAPCHAPRHAPRHARIHTGIHTGVHTGVHTGSHTGMCACSHADMCACTRADMCACSRARSNSLFLPPGSFACAPTFQV